MSASSASKARSERCVPEPRVPLMLSHRSRVRRPRAPPLRCCPGRSQGGLEPIQRRRNGDDRVRDAPELGASAAPAWPAFSSTMPIAQRVASSTSPIGCPRRMRVLARRERGRLRCHCATPPRPTAMCACAASSNCPVLRPAARFPARSPAHSPTGRSRSRRRQAGCQRSRVGQPTDPIERARATILRLNRSAASSSPA